MGLRKQLASKSAILFAVRIAGAGTIFLAQAAMARFWAPEQLGEYLIAIATINLLAIALPLGLQTVGSYFAAEYAAKGDGGALRSFAQLSYGIILIFGLPLTFGVGQLVKQFGDTGEMISSFWWPISAMAFGSAVFFVNAGILVGLKRPFTGYFADTIFRPIIIVGAFAFAYFTAAQTEQVVTLLWVLASVYCIVIAVQTYITLQGLKTLPGSSESQGADYKRWFYFALPWIIITLSTDFFFDADLLMLTAFLSKEQIAVFGVCTRIFVLASYGITAVYAVTMPGMLEDATAENQEGLSAKIGDANMIAAVLAVILTFGVAIASPLILGLFGKDFSAGYLPLVILCTSLVVRSVFGPGPLILSSKNRPYASLPSVAIGLTVLVVSNYFLVPLIGLSGAAAAAAISYFAGSLSVWRKTLSVTGTDVSIFPALRKLVNRA